MLPRTFSLRTLSTPIAAALLLTATSGGAQTNPKPTEPQQNPEPRKRLSYRIGDMVRVDLRARVQVDWRNAESPLDFDSPLDVRRARLGVAGTLLKRIDYELERDFREKTHPWRDAYIRLDAPRGFRVQAGRFKVPFSADRLNSAMELDFLNRSLAATYLAPGRDMGVKVEGRFIGQMGRYEAGIFRGGGDELEGTLTGARGRALAGRVTIRPWNTGREAGALQALTFGGAFTTSTVPEEATRLDARTFADERLFEIYLRGRHQRLGGELEWRNGPFSVKGELMRVSAQRLGQSIDDGDLPNVAARGWYVSGTWVMTGEHKTDNIRPTRSLLQGGTGALELAARVERLGIGATEGGAAPSRSPRALSVLDQSNRALTLGINWYPHPNIKIQANAIREHLALGFIDGSAQSARWSRALRFQFSI